MSKTYEQWDEELRYCATVVAEGTKEVPRHTAADYLRTQRAGAARDGLHGTASVFLQALELVEQGQSGKAAELLRDAAS